MAIGVAIAGVAALQFAGGFLSRKSGRDAARARQEITNIFAEEKAAMSQRQNAQVRDLQQLALGAERVIAGMETDVEKAMAKQSAGVAIAKTRSKRQVARISGLGGSFAQVSGAETEIKFQLEQRLERIQDKADIAEQNRILREKGQALTFFQNIERSIFELKATQSGAAVTAQQQKQQADVSLIQGVVGGASTLLKGLD